MRVSYIVMPSELIGKFKETGEIIETSQPLLPQKILTLFLSEGHFFKHLKKMRALYQQRRMMVYKALDTVYPGLFDYEHTDGGMHIVVFLKQGVQDVQLAELWNSFNLQVFPLSGWYSQKNKRYGLVIGYTNIKSEQEAIAALSLAYKDTMALLKEYVKF